MKNVPEQMKDDLCTAAVTQNGHALNWAAQEMKRDIDVVRAAVRQEKAAIKYALWRDSKEMKRDRELCTAAVTPEHGRIEILLRKAPKGP